ncbi:ureidoglycolate lyase [Bordetella petrii]|uniref:ureidoglycolate lyase n=1 Tax=Bordetella petrii TaxID=94624 RepID=UPI001E2C1D63|nr:ureidoglycolate lyase [Bordetella petrii]MCD0501676.1 ureidoglycolate lyase [Bordetella petrii]
MPSLYAQPITADAFAPYGEMLGKPFPARPGVPAFTNAATDFWREHLFDPGQDGVPEILWVNYRASGPVTHLEKHLLTQQAIVPLTGSIVHVVARSLPDGRPDLATLAAFAIPPGQGLCMAPHCWHATRVAAQEVACLMLTRQSTTLDLVTHLQDGRDATESAIEAVPEIAWQLPGR